LNFEGIYTPAVTPYAADGKIDEKAFAEVLETLGIRFWRPRQVSDRSVDETVQ
jgi:hypothetical protein